MSLRATILVELDIFSGRPNPTWTVDEAEVQNRLSSLAEGGASMKEIPTLGYRGLIVHDPQGAVRVFGGTVERNSRLYVDAARQLELWLLNHATNAVQPEILDLLKRSN